MTASRRGPGVAATGSRRRRGADDPGSRGDGVAATPRSRRPADVAALRRTIHVPGRVAAARDDAARAATRPTAPLTPVFAAVGSAAALPTAASTRPNVFLMRPRVNSGSALSASALAAVSAFNASALAFAVAGSAFSASAFALSASAGDVDGAASSFSSKRSAIL